MITKSQLNRCIDHIDTPGIVVHNLVSLSIEKDPGMEFHIGTYIAIAAVLLFYLRLIILQRQKLKNGQSKQASKQGKKNGKAKGAASSTAALNAYRPTIVVANKLLVFLGVALILLGALISFLSSLPTAVRDAWWLPVTVGILLMGLGIR